MKKRFLVMVAIFGLGYCTISAQAPPAPPGNAGAGGGPVGSNPLSAPVDGGLTVFVAFAAAMAGRSLCSKYRLFKNE